MTAREANTDLLAEIAALRERIASLTRENATLHGALTQAGEQQTATSEILRVISSSPTDVQPVFDGIVRSAVRLCGAVHSALFRLDRGLVKLAAHHNFTHEARAIMERIFPAPLGDPLPAAQVIRSGESFHVADVLVAPGVAPEARRVGETLGFRNLLIVPMLLHNRAIGAIAVARGVAEMFSEDRCEVDRVPRARR